MIFDETLTELLEPGLEVKKLEYSLKLKIKRNDWLLMDTSLRFILSLRINSSFITSRHAIIFKRVLDSLNSFIMKKMNIFQLQNRFLPSNLIKI